jgi:hypothetical protein
MTLFRIMMKRLIVLIFGLIFILGCNGQNGQTTTTVDCNQLNDSAMSLVIQQDFSNSLELINSAVECDPDNNVFIRNKGMILANAGMYQDCINYLGENNNQFTRVELLSTMAECHFHLNDSVAFDSLRIKVLLYVEQEFNKAKNESNLITFLTILKKFDGERKTVEVLNSNRDLFTTPDMDSHMLEFLESVQTLKI